MPTNEEHAKKLDAIAEGFGLFSPMPSAEALRAGAAALRAQKEPVKPPVTIDEMLCRYKAYIIDTGGTEDHYDRATIKLLEAVRDVVIPRLQREVALNNSEPADGGDYIAPERVLAALGVN